MMSLFGELLRSLRARSLGPLALGGLALVLFLMLLALFLLAWSGLGGGEQGELLALLDPQLTTGQVDQLYLEIREWEEVARVEFIFKEEVKAGGVKLAVPDPGTDLFRISLHNPREAAAVGERLRGLAGIGRVIASRRGSLKEILRSTAGMHALTLALLIVLGLLSLVNIRSAIRSLIISWRGELRLLYLAGVGPRGLGTPFLLLALLPGLGGGLVLVLGLYVAHLWGQSHLEALYRSLPALLNSTTVLSLALLSLGMGLGVGLLGGAWGLVALRRAIRP